MENYIGLKSVKARPMTRGEYNDYRFWELPEDEKHLADEDGMLVEDPDVGRTNDARHNGYISWLPLDVFEKSYKSAGEFKITID